MSCSKTLVYEYECKLGTIRSEGNFVRRPGACPRQQGWRRCGFRAAREAIRPQTSPNCSKRHTQQGGFARCSSRSILEGLPKPVRIPRGLQILNLALSHHCEPVADEAAQATDHKRGVHR